MSTLKAIAVEWNDITEQSGWHSQDEHKDMRPLYCFSVGFLVDETDDYIVMSDTYGIGQDENRWGTVTIIPKGCIRIKTWLCNVDPIRRS